jgi:nicotinate dehydrogenase subunit A
MNGEAVRSCGVPVTAARNQNITTLEGLGTPARPHRLQTAFIEEQAGQCAYCINGMIMTAKVLLDKNPKPTDSEIKNALASNLCRCGSHLRIVRAVQRASGQRA